MELSKSSHVQTTFIVVSDPMVSTGRISPNRVSINSNSVSLNTGGVSSTEKPSEDAMAAIPDPKTAFTEMPESRWLHLKNWIFQN